MMIRKLQESDYCQVVDLYAQLDDLHVQARPDYFVHREKDSIYSMDAFIHNLSYPEGLELGIFDDKLLVGIVQATLWNESGMVKGVKTVCLDNLFVLPAYRRKGVATKLFSEVESWAREQGAIRLDLHVWDFNSSAITLYQTMGMTPQRYVFEKLL